MEEKLTAQMMQAAANCKDINNSDWQAQLLRDGAEEIERLRVILKKSRDGLSCGLWDYGPGQDEHEQCSSLIIEIDTVLTPNVK